MKTSILLLDSITNLDYLIDSAFSFSKQVNRRLKIVYIWDFLWNGNEAYIGTGAPDLIPGIQFAQEKMEEEYKVAESRIKKVCSDYLKNNSSVVPYEIDISSVDRWTYLQKEMSKDNDLFLIMSNRNTYSEVSGGKINHSALIDEITCPVLLLPANGNLLSINSIVYATAFNENDLNALQHLDVNLGNTSHKQLTVFHCTDKTSFESTLMWKGFQQLVSEQVIHLPLQFVLQRSEDKNKSLLDVAKSEQTELFVMLKRDKGFFRELFTPSDTHYVQTRFNKPLLIYHQKRWTERQK